MPTRRSAAGLLLVGLLLPFSQVGCAAMFGMSVTEAPAKPAVGTCTVEIRPEIGSRKTEEITLTEGMHLQDVAQACGAAGKFRQMDGYVLREGENGRKFQMEGRWNRSSRSFSLDTDYAIEPGDHVLFVEDSSTPVDSVLSLLLGPLGR